jgi:hypothetical protein
MYVLRFSGTELIFVATQKFKRTSKHSTNQHAIQLNSGTRQLKLGQLIG